jgi:hypothetical protein
MGQVCYSKRNLEIKTTKASSTTQAEAAQCKYEQMKAKVEARCKGMQ